MLSMETTRLIERCRQGDADALGELYKAYAQRMRGVCRRYISDEQTVDDVLHDAFVIIFTSFDRLRDDRKAEAWMMSITRNVASKYKDHLKSHPFVPLEDAESFLLRQASLGAERMVANEETSVIGVPLEEVMKLIDKLPEGYAGVFRLSVFEGLSHKEIAAMLGIEPHSSSSQLARAKKMLRKMMQQYWAAAVLLLLVPITFYLFRKGDTAVKGEKPVVAKQKDTTKKSPTEQPQKPVIVHVPTHHTTTIATDNQPSLIAQAVDSVTVDTLSNIARHEQATTDTLSSDTAKTVHRVELPRYDIADLFPEKPATGADDRKWSAQLAYAGQLDEQHRYNQPFSYKPVPSAVMSDLSPSPIPPIPSSIDNWADYAVYLANRPNAVSDETRSILMRIALNNANQPGGDKIVRSSHHRMPVTWSLAVKYQLNHRFGLESGLGYSRLTSDFETGSSGNAINEQQTIHYLGIPVKGIYNIYNRKMWSIYGSIGLMTEIPVHATLHSDFYVNGRYETSDKMTLRAPWQFSTTLGLGLQYHLTPGLGLFAEPSLQYYIPMKTDIETYRTEHPFTFSVPLGIRFTW